MEQIAHKANISAANLYIYFDSKFDIFFAVYETWLSAFIDNLERNVRSVDDPRAKVEQILTALWITLPRKNKGFSISLLQALSLKTPAERYSGRLLLVSEARIYDLLRESLPAEVHIDAKEALPRLLFMAMDGFVLNWHLRSDDKDVSKIVRLVCDLLLPGPA